MILKVCHLLTNGISSLFFPICLELILTMRMVRYVHSLNIQFKNCVIVLLSLCRKSEMAKDSL